MEETLGPERRERNRRRNWLLITVVVVMIVVLHAAGFEPRRDHPYFAAPGPYVIAHQGGDGERPGNTMAAFRHGHALGADVLEMDVHLSADGQLVLIHDDTVDRTTNGSGRVVDMTLAELQGLDAGWHWPFQASVERPWRGQGLRIPHLQEVLSAFPLARYNIEMKTDNPDLATALCALLKANGAQSQTLVASSRSTAMATFREACPDTAVSALPGEVRILLLAAKLRMPWLYRGNADAMQVPVDYGWLTIIDKPFIDAARAANIHVDAWTVNDPVQLDALTGLGIGGVITDVPGRYLERLGRLKPLGQRPQQPPAAAAGG